MPYVEQTGLPFAPGSHTSYKAAKSISPEARAKKTHRYLALLREKGPHSDHAAAAILGFPLQSICSLRNGVMRRGLVERCGERMGPYGKAVSLWRVMESSHGD